MGKALSGKLSCTGTDLVFKISNSAVGDVDDEDVHFGDSIPTQKRLL